MDQRTIKSALYLSQRLQEDLDSNLEVSDNRNASSRKAPDRRKVFVVYGRNIEARNAIFTFLRAISLQPLEWNEVVRATGQSMPYIGDILTFGFSMAQAALVLLTPDDEVRLIEKYANSHEPKYETELTPQARPNVIYEAGMAMGLYPDRTVIVEIGRLRPFSDIGGLLTLKLNNSSEKRQELAQRLQIAGCNVNINGTDWHKSGGDFDLLV